MFDLSPYSTAELAKMLKAIPGEILRRESEDKTRALKEVEALAKQFGYSLEDLINQPTAKESKARKPVAIRYRSPEGQTWTGRGRSPTWLSDAIANGASKDDFAV